MSRKMKLISCNLLFFYYVVGLLSSHSVSHTKQRTEGESRLFLLLDFRLFFCLFSVVVAGWVVMCLTMISKKFLWFFWHTWEIRRIFVGKVVGYNSEELERKLFARLIDFHHIRVWVKVFSALVFPSRDNRMKLNFYFLVRFLLLFLWKSFPHDWNSNLQIISEIIEFIEL